MIDFSNDMHSRAQECERAVLSHILTTKRIPIGVISDMFYGAEERLFNEISTQYVKHKAIDLIALTGDMKTLAIDCLNCAGSMSEAVINELEKHRVLRNRTEAVLKAIQSPDPIQSTSELQRELSALLLARSSGKYVHHAEISKMVDAFQAAAMRKHGEVLGYSCGVTGIDNLTNGFVKGKLYIVGGLKKTGKSRFCIQCAIEAANSGARVMWESLEMSAYDLNTLGVSYYSGLDSAVFCRSMAKTDVCKYQVGIDKMIDINWLIYQDYTIPEIRARVSHEKTTGKIDVVIVDFIQRMRAPEYKGDRVREVEAIAKGLADISREMDVAIIALSQLSNSAEQLEGDAMPDMRHMKESGGIAENADCIITMHSPDRHKSPYVNNAYVCPTIRFKIEQRYGVSGEVINTDADLRNCRFVQQAY